jgi:hypothetical protein
MNILTICVVLFCTTVAAANVIREDFNHDAFTWDNLNENNHSTDNAEADDIIGRVRIAIHNSGNDPFLWGIHFLGFKRNYTVHNLGNIRRQGNAAISTIGDVKVLQTLVRIKGIYAISNWTQTDLFGVHTGNVSTNVTNVVIAVLARLNTTNDNLELATYDIISVGPLIHDFSSLPRPIARSLQYLADLISEETAARIGNALQWLIPNTVQAIIDKANIPA